MMKLVIALVVALVVGAGVVLVYQGQGAKEQSPPLQIIAAESHVIDCSQPDFLEDSFKDKNGKVVKVLEKKEESVGELVGFLESPKWVNKCGVDDIKENAGALAGFAIYNFTVDREDTYYVYLRAKWTDTCGNSCWIRMNGPEKGSHDNNDEKSRFYLLEDQDGMKNPKEYDTCWHELKEKGDRKKFQLKKGQNHIEIHTREDGPRFYQLMVTTEASKPINYKAMKVNSPAPASPEVVTYSTDWPHEKPADSK